MDAAQPCAAPAGRRRVLPLVRTASSYLLVALLAVLVWPVDLGGCASLTVVSGRSMEPTMSSGDVVVARCGQPQVGDVVIYRPAELDGQRIIHRIIGGGPDGWQLQGDNNDFVDPFTPTDDEIIGIELARVPYVGRVVSWADNPFVWLSVLALALGLVLWPSPEDDEDDPDDADDEESPGLDGRTPAVPAVVRTQGADDPGAEREGDR